MTGNYSVALVYLKALAELIFVKSSYVFLRKLESFYKFFVLAVISGVNFFFSYAQIFGANAVKFKAVFPQSGVAVFLNILDVA